MKAAGKATTKLAGQVYKSLVKCHETVLACAEQKPDDAKCLAKGGKTCSGLLAKIADGSAALEDAVVGKCTAAGFGRSLPPTAPAWMRSRRTAERSG